MYYFSYESLPINLDKNLKIKSKENLQETMKTKKNLKKMKI